MKEVIKEAIKMWTMVIISALALAFAIHKAKQDVDKQTEYAERQIKYSEQQAIRLNYQLEKLNEHINNILDKNKK